MPTDSQRTCALDGCSNPVIGHPNKMYCSPSHRVTAARRMARARGEVWATYSPRPAVKLTCAMPGCTVEFTRAGRQIYCTPQHADAAYKLRTRGKPRRSGG